MAAITPDLGAGATLVLTGQTIFATAKSIKWDGMKRDAVETTTLATTGGRTFMPTDTYDPGEITCELQLDTDGMTSAIFTGAAAVLTLTFPDLETMTVSAFVTDFNIDIPDDRSVMMATIVMKATGTVTF